MKDKPCVFITGGAGFIGIHTAQHFLSKGWRVVVLDNFSRPGVRENVHELQRYDDFDSVAGDIANPRDIRQAFAVAGGNPGLIVHLAAQVAITSSIEDPRLDFDTNLRGTFELLEAVRHQPKGSRPGLLVFASTNKVYGRLSNMALEATETRYRLRDGVGSVAEDAPLDFHTPYACSKGAGEQYVRDYARIFGLPTVALRNSCIYGPNQFGREDQGWVAHFSISSQLGVPIKIYGNGKQVRDVLYIDDLVRLIDLLYENRRSAVGAVYNVGGGPDNTVSLLELVRMLERRVNKKIQTKFAPPRVGDQYFYVSDISRLRDEMNWTPKVSLETGLDRTLSWVEAHLPMIKKALDVRFEGGAGTGRGFNGRAASVGPQEQGGRQRTQKR